MELTKRDKAENYVNEELAAMEKDGSLPPGRPTPHEYENLVQQVLKVMTP